MALRLPFPRTPFPKPQQRMQPMLGKRFTSIIVIPFSIAVCVVMLASWFGAGRAMAQDNSGATDKQFAPGIVTTIPPEVLDEETVSIHDLVEIRADKKLAREPSSTSKSRTLIEMAHDAHFRTPTWCLQLSFKPLRMIQVDMPQRSGKMQRKLLWYMVYRVRNTGAGLAAAEQDDGTFAAVEHSTERARFIPQFVLSMKDRDRESARIRKAYLDRIIPAALQPIRRRESFDGELLNSAQMAEHLLTVEKGRSSRGVWGVVTWEDVDPEIDFFSVYVGGLTNSLQWQDPPETYKLGNPPGTGRQFLRKTLQLNFWRPGDAYAENEREIRYGVPPGKAEIYDCNEGVAYRWVYR